MRETILALVQTCANELNTVKTEQALILLKSKYLGKSGELTLILRGMKDLSGEERPIVGKFVNEAREEMEALIAKRQKQVEQTLLNERLNNEKVDITLPAAKIITGNLHPQTLVKNEILDIFIALGFEVTDGPEIETDYYNFEALNTPEDHPARDAQDTFFITDKILLRSQTSTTQIRTMENRTPPIKMISPGRVYRSDEVDATHSPVFHQIEGLVVDKDISMKDLKGILDMFAKKYFGEATKTRLRPSFFPFTEPSVEVDASCSQCNGKGCRVCKGTGWIEILGAGMVNRRVLKNCNIDPDIYTGLAFGVGLDRITNIKYGITDLRVVYENDIRFLKQFK